MWYCARNFGSYGLRVQHGLIFPAITNHLWHRVQYSGAVMAALHGPNPVMLREMVVRCEYMRSINKETKWSSVKIFKVWKQYQINQNCKKHNHFSNRLNSLQVMQPLLSPYAKQHLKTQLVKWRFLDQEVAVKDGLAVRENVVLKTLVPGATVLSLITNSR